jgi:hypothetical protein
MPSHNAEGTERCTVADSLLTRNDGNGVFLSMYNLNTTISGNEVSWHGDTAFAAWGVTGKCLTEKCEGIVLAFCSQVLHWMMALRFHNETTLKVLTSWVACGPDHELCLPTLNLATQH